jgi:hypothetical protein
MAIDTDAALSKAEQSGLKLAIKGRLLAALLFLTFYVAVGKITWSDLPAHPTRGDFLAMFFDPDFIGTGNRLTESLCLLVSAGILALAVGRARNLVRTEASAQAARENLARYVSPNLVERLAAEVEPFGAVRRQQAAILFVDVVGFTRFAEQNTPETVIAFLREFHGRMAQAVFDHEGTLDDYIGDEVMAVFGGRRLRDTCALRGPVWTTAGWLRQGPSRA